jgi:TetR/AcrR family transcriptional regulator, ethionamide resistance regulator
MMARPLQTRLSARGSSARTPRRDARAAVLAAARARLASGGLRELSVDAVMRELGMTRTAFYRYFDDLAALVQVLLAEITMPLEHALAGLARGTGSSSSEAFRQALTDVAGVFAEHGRVLSATVAAASYDDAIDDVVQDLRERFARMAAKGLSERASASGLALSDPLETARAMNAMNESYLLYAFGGSTPISIERAVEALWPPWRELLRLDAPTDARTPARPDVKPTTRRRQT